MQDEITNVTPIRAMTDEEALSWLRSQPDGKTNLAQVDLAKRWGLSRHQVARRIASWMKRGLVRKDKTGALVATAKAAQVSEQRAQDEHPEARTDHVPPPAPEAAQPAAQSPAHERSRCAAQDTVVTEEKPRAPVSAQPPEREVEERSSGAVIEAPPAHVADAPPLVPGGSPAHSVPASARVRAHPVGDGLVAVPETWVSYPISEWHILLVGIGIILEASAAFLSIPGFMRYFSGWPLAAGLLCALIEGGKFFLSIFLAALWHRTGWIRRFVGMLFIAGAMLVSAWMVLNELIAMHLADHGTVAAGIEKKDTETAILIRTQQGVLADVDRRLGQIDAAIEEATKRGKTNTALAAIESQRRTRAGLQDERKREAAALASLETQRAQVTVQARQADVDMAPTRRALQMLGLTADDITVDRWQFLVILLLLDPLAIFFATWAGSLRRR